MKAYRAFLFAVITAVVPMLLLSSSVLQAQSNPSGESPLLLGTAWYPEQWPEARWEADLELMQKAGIHVVRVGEFSWSTLEPAEGRYDFGWLQRAIALAAKHGINTVVGTPTATPPAWLTQKYPETLLTLETGKKDEHGNRAQFNFSDPKYREFCRDLALHMAETFGHNKNVIGWQIGNEYSRPSFDAGTRTKFQQWLQQKYGTLDNLNARWTTTYWSEAYSNWNQIPIETTRGNPGLLLNWKRFVSDTWRSFQKDQLDMIRTHVDSHQFVTTNMMGWFDGFDAYTVVQDLDIAAVDSYVGQGHFDPSRDGSVYDLTRGLLRKNFWVMETQPGFVNWAPINNSLDKGEVRAMAWTQVGHGADAVCYWQWRSALNGQEQYHGTLVGPDGLPVPIYYEVAQMGKEFAKAGPLLAGTAPHSDVAIFNSYDSRWAIDLQRHNQGYDPVHEILSYYRPLRKVAQSVDIISTDGPLEQYKLIVAPGLNVLTELDAKRLAGYVRQGGHLVLGQRSGMKTADNSLHTTRQPGPLSDLLGGEVEQFYALKEPAPVDGQWGKSSTQLWAELLTLKARDVEVIERHGKSNGWLDGQPAVITRQVGKGRITYAGVWMDDAGMDRAAAWMAAVSGLKPALGGMPDGVDVYPRYGAKNNIYILVNTGKGSAKVALPKAMQDVLGDGETKVVELPQYGVAVLSEPHE